MAAFETLLKVPAVHAIEVLLDPDDGSLIIAQRDVRQVVQIPAHALESLAHSIEVARKANKAGA